MTVLISGRRVFNSEMMIMMMMMMMIIIITMRRASYDRGLNSYIDNVVFRHEIPKQSFEIATSGSQNRLMGGNFLILQG